MAPIVIAHRGASGHRPEHSRAAFALAIAQGADAVEVDVVPTRDGRLLVRHEPELSGSTDVASRSEFAARRRRGTLAADPVGPGRAITGWFAEDFTAAEAATLGALERMPRLRAANLAHDGGPLLLLEQVLELAAASGTTVVVELKHAARSAALGLPLDDLLVEALDRVAALPPLIVESFEHRVLRRLAAAGFPHPLVALLGGWRHDRDLPTAGEPVTRLRDELADPARFADLQGVSLHTRLLRPETVGGFRDAGLDVWTWTLRPENCFLPPHRWLPGGPSAFGRYAEHWRALAATGVTGVFADHPDLALAALGGRPHEAATPGAPDAVGAHA